MEAEYWKIFQQGSGLGSNIEDVVETDRCKVLKLKDASGEGLMTLYPVFDGVYLMYNDFHMSSCQSEYQKTGSWFCIDHCREGRIQMTGNKGSYFMEAGDVRVDQRVHHAGQVYFPLNHYHGITIGFEKDTSLAAMKKEMPGIPFDFEQILNRLNIQDQPCVLQKNERITRIFEDLYQVPSKMRIPYYRVKIMELLILLSTMELSTATAERRFFYATQVEKVKAIEQFITEHMDQNFTLLELSERFDIAQTTLKSCFKQMFGTSVYAYLKEYRMNQAAVLLKTQRQRKVSEIALDVGYETPGKFSNAFKAVFGSTPVEYRNQIYPESKMDI